MSRKMGSRRVGIQLLGPRVINHFHSKILPIRTNLKVMCTNHQMKNQDRATVDKFYEAAISAGAKDNGKPGPRPYSGPHYYGAYVFDPVGNNIEAVTEKPE